MRKQENNEIVLHIKSKEKLFFSQNEKLGISTEPGITIIESLLLDRLLSKGTRIEKIRIVLKDKVNGKTSVWVRDGVKKYCDLKVKGNDLAIKKAKLKGKLGLRYALSFVAFSAVLSFIIFSVDKQTSNELLKLLWTFLQGLLVIAAWVSLWGPLEALMYDWRPYDIENKVLKIIKMTKVEVENE